MRALRVETAGLLQTAHLRPSENVYLTDAMSVSSSANHKRESTNTQGETPDITLTRSLEHADYVTKRGEKTHIIV